MHADLSGRYVEFASELGHLTVDYLWFTEWADEQYRYDANGRPNHLESTFAHEGFATSPRRIKS
jgi:hypothetical protein